MPELALTLFTDRAASSKTEKTFQLAALAERIRTKTATEKDKLPWLKLARFGDIRTERNSLRHDGNVIAITGIEADYDAEQMSFEEAMTKLVAAGLLAVIYTSPSHTAARPRWRVLCPFSAPCAPQWRDRYMGRLAGLFGGIFGAESWVLSQSYFYGSVGTNPDHQVELIDGTPIDLADELDAVWAEKPTRHPTSARGQSPPPNEPLDRPSRTDGGSRYGLAALERECDAIRSAPFGQQEHTLNAASLKIGALVAGGELDEDIAMADLFAAGRNMPSQAGRPAWQASEVENKIRRAFEDGKRMPRQPQDRPRAHGNGNGRDHDPAPEWEDAGDNRSAAEPPPDPGSNGAFGTWPEVDPGPATRDVLPAPALPLDVFPPLWRAWIERASERAGCPPDYVACSVLAVLGATIGNAAWGSPWPGWEHPPVLFMACAGLPSAGKSPGQDVVARHMVELAADLNDDWDERQAEFRTAKQEAKERRTVWEAKVKEAVKNGHAAPREPDGAAEPDPPRQRRAHSTDPTTEAARDLSAANPRGLLLHRDELAGWIEGMARYGNEKAGAARAFWLEAYEGRRHVADRVKDGGDPINIPHLSWGVLGGFQPDRLASALLAGDDDGLPARFLYSWPAPARGVSPRPSNKPLPFELKVKLRRLRELPMPDGEPVILRFTEEAAEELQEFRGQAKQLEDDATGLYLSWVGKLPGFAVRLATIWAHMRWLAEAEPGLPPMEITLDDLAPALGFLDEYAIGMARRAFGEAALPQAEQDARRLARWLLKQNPRPEVLNARALRRLANGPGIRDAERMEDALTELEELGWVRRPPPRRTGGRHSGDWEVNPRLRAP